MLLLSLFFYCFQGARDLAKPPTFTDIFHSNLNNSENKEEDSRKQQHQEGNKKGLKRKFDSNESSDDQGDDSQKKDGPSPKDKRMKKAKNVCAFSVLFCMFCLFCSLLIVCLRCSSSLQFPWQQKQQHLQEN